MLNVQLKAKFSPGPGTELGRLCWRKAWETRQNPVNERGNLGNGRESPGKIWKTEGFPDFNIV